MTKKHEPSMVSSVIAQSMLAVPLASLGMVPNEHKIIPKKYHLYSFTMIVNL